MSLELVPCEKTTYVLAGHDSDGAFTELLNAYGKRGDVVVVRADDGKSFEQTLKDHPIPPGANVVIACHGGEDGKITWRENENIPYSQVFQALPRQGIPSISVASCFGGTAQQFLPSVPYGCVLLSLVGEKTENTLGNFILQGTGPVDMLLSALNHTNPDEVAGNIRLWNKEHNQNNNYSPGDILPHTIGIGGHPPITINLDHVVDSIEYSAAHHSLNKKFYDKAVKKAQDSLTTVDSNFIANIGDRMRQGRPLEGEQEQRIGYAIAASYLETSGDMEMYISMGRSSAPPQVQAQTPERPKPEPGNDRQARQPSSAPIPSTQAEDIINNLLKEDPMQKLIQSNALPSLSGAGVTGGNHVQTHPQSSRVDGVSPLPPTEIFR